MFRDIIKLSEKNIFSEVKTITRDEFYKSVQSSLNVSLQAKIRKANYNNEKEFKYKNTDFFIIRTHESTDDFMYLVAQESDLKNTIKIIDETHKQDDFGNYELDEESTTEEEVDAKIEFFNSTVERNQLNTKTRTIKKAKIKIRKRDMELSDKIEINNSRYTIESINDLMNLGVWLEIIAVEVL